MKNITIVLVLCEVCFAYAVVLTRCKLAKKIVDTHVFEKTYLGSWVCLIEKESNRDTELMVQKPHNQNYYGLFQIPQKYCRLGRKGGDCNMSCEDLLSSNVAGSCRCAHQIWLDQGFKFWRKWQRLCGESEVNHITQEIYKCPEMMTYSRSTSYDEHRVQPR